MRRYPVAGERSDVEYAWPIILNVAARPTNPVDHYVHRGIESAAVGRQYFRIFSTSAHHLLLSSNNLSDTMLLDAARQDRQSELRAGAKFASLRRWS